MVKFWPETLFFRLRSWCAKKLLAVEDQVLGRSKRHTSRKEKKLIKDLLVGGFNPSEKY
jgi:hypothetical protein